VGGGSGLKPGVVPDRGEALIDGQPLEHFVTPAGVPPVRHVEPLAADVLEAGEAGLKVGDRAFGPG
jgi:hypothetical protein